mgnify:CR=1 FL=1
MILLVLSSTSFILLALFSELILPVNNVFSFKFIVRVEILSITISKYIKIINGERRETKGSGSGANPRTAIGQRKDGTILLLVTDGRGANGHLGATASDLIDVMEEYGAVNAANLDGGSSSSMYYNDKYEMTSVTLYYSNSSWRLPTGFIVSK